MQFPFSFNVCAMAHLVGDLRVPAKDCVFGLVDWNKRASQKRKTVAVGMKVAYHLQIANCNSKFKLKEHYLSG